MDDFEQRIDLIIRGDDLLTSTGRQLRLARMLGRREMPGFVHHPLIRHSTGVKLSKANRDTGVRDLRAAGFTPDRGLGQAAHLTGLTAKPLDLKPSDLPALFDSDQYL